MPAALVSDDPRHLRRVRWMQRAFALTFKDDPQQRQQTIVAHPEMSDFLDAIAALDQEIQAVAPERPLDQINKVDLAILRTIMFEWKTQQTPKKVLIDEGIELAKEFGTDSSPRFVNGVLAQLLK